MGISEREGKKRMAEEILEILLTFSSGLAKLSRMNFVTSSL